MKYYHRFSNSYFSMFTWGRQNHWSKLTSLKCYFFDNLFPYKVKILLILWTKLTCFHGLQKITLLVTRVMFVCKQRYVNAIDIRAYIHICVSLCLLNIYTKLWLTHSHSTRYHTVELNLKGYGYQANLLTTQLCLYAMCNRKKWWAVYRQRDKSYYTYIHVTKW